MALWHASSPLFAIKLLDNTSKFLYIRVQRYNCRLCFIICKIYDVTGANMTARHGWPKKVLVLNNFLFFFLLICLSLVFFAMVRNNSFWHPGDYLYLRQALKIEHDWRAIFNASPYGIFQPIVNGVFFMEYHFFGLNTANYYLFNIFLHAVNSFLVYLIVLTLLRDRTIAVLSSLLFVFAVGNYGKAVMVASGVSDLLITLLTLLTLLFYFKNELEKGGKLLSFWFLGSILFFGLSLLTKATSFSILGCMLAFNIFFRSETRKLIIHRNFLVVTIFALAVVIAKHSVFMDIPGRHDMVFFSPRFFRNFGSYLVRMVFPVHGSRLVSHAGPVVQFIYNLATEIRILTFLCILSYSIFGFIFGNRTIRFFIAWTYITVLPFCFFKFPDDWLNIRYLYLVSVGYVMLLASGTVLAARLLYQRPWRRLVPYLIPLLFILMSHFITSNLDKNYERNAADSRIQEMRKTFMERAQE